MSLKSFSQCRLHVKYILHEMLKWLTIHKESVPNYRGGKKIGEKDDSPQ